MVAANGDRLRADDEHLAQGSEGPSTVRFARPGAEQRAAVALLDAAEAAAGGPLVDEQERARLDQVAVHDSDPAQHWHPVLSWPSGGEAGDGPPTGYAGLLLPPSAEAVGDLVPAVAAPAGTVPQLLDAARILAAEHGSRSVAMWLRHAEEPVLAAAVEAGWTIRRRLLVLVCDLSAERPHDPMPEWVAVQPHQPSDDAEVATLLRRAYADTDDEDWSTAEVIRRRKLPWFRSEDMLLAWRRGDGLVGVHWTKRRSSGVGEVYNLAVDPAAQGLGVGSALLDAGLDHLAKAGVEQVALWVDSTNEPGLSLYASRAFTQRWQDVCLTAPTDIGPTGGGSAG